MLVLAYVAKRTSLPSFHCEKSTKRRLTGLFVALMGPSAPFCVPVIVPSTTSVSPATNCTGLVWAMSGIVFQ